MNAINRTNEIGKIDVVKNGPSKSGVNNGAKIQGNGKVGGSRFEILNEVLEENVDVTKEQFRVCKQKTPDAGKVLSDISNRGKTTNEQLSSHSKKFLVVNKDRFNKPFKVNGKGEGSSSIGKGYRGGKQSGKVVVSQQEGMEDELEDSDVLKALHQEMLDSGLTDKDAGESSMETIGDSGPADSGYPNNIRTTLFGEIIENQGKTCVINVVCVMFSGENEVQCVKRKLLLEALGTIRYSSKAVSIEESAVMALSPNRCSSTGKAFNAVFSLAMKVKYHSRN
ncbi:hypothetical protein EZV62_011857 [Acer yangbiense]|uniref:Uncharacterized protein n=1 Tax=Acer yangbiense TaxID=1000413 RepID=A0A5C7I5Q8_9ROSI|nr:hypothetical protein EZV62_011857 [Acer yangbiense]